MIALLFLCAFALSGAAGFYSIAGLMAIFAAAPIPIAIMGTTLEVSKLVIASWLYRNWSEIPRLMKGYLTTSLVILMFLTSMGIFGFLSKAHLDQGVPTGDVAAAVALIDEKIKIEKDNITSSKAALAQLDQQVNQTISRTSAASDDTAVQRSVALRRSQTKERQDLLSSIQSSQQKIAALNEERAPKAAELRKVEAEVGPIKYIAALIYEEDTSQDILEKAVRWVTLLIVVVFDPLAVVLLIAANWSLAHRPVSRPPPTEPPTPSAPEPIKDDPPSNNVMPEQQEIEKPLPPIDLTVEEPKLVAPPEQPQAALEPPIDQPEEPPPQLQAALEPSIDKPVESPPQYNDIPPDRDYEEVWLSRPKNHIRRV